MKSKIFMAIDHSANLLKIGKSNKDDVTQVIYNINYRYKTKFKLLCYKPSDIGIDEFQLFLRDDKIYLRDNYNHFSNEIYTLRSYKVQKVLKLFANYTVNDEIKMNHPLISLDCSKCHKDFTLNHNDYNTLSEYFEAYRMMYCTFECKRSFDRFCKVCGTRYTPISNEQNWCDNECKTTYFKLSLNRK